MQGRCHHTVLHGGYVEQASGLASGSRASTQLSHCMVHRLPRAPTVPCTYVLQSCLVKRYKERNPRDLTMGRGREVGKDTASPAMRKETLQKTFQEGLQADTRNSLVMFPFMLRKGIIHTAPHCSYIM